MRATVHLSPGLIERARREALRRGLTFSDFVEHGLQLAITTPQPPPRRHVHLPVSRARGGTLPGVNLDKGADLLDL
ncbi:MAG: hypothetical protein HZB13_18150 [Acidobacteria bacterium]|nr:hypothetical protein [Acidobacteriota bacterium]